MIQLDLNVFSITSVYICVLFFSFYSVFLIKLINSIYLNVKLLSFLLSKILNNFSFFKKYFLILKGKFIFSFFFIVSQKKKYTVGVAKKDQLWFNDSGSQVFDLLVNFHNDVLIIMVWLALFLAIWIFFTLYLFLIEPNIFNFYTIRNYNTFSPEKMDEAKVNFFEILWSAIPAIIIFFITFPSFSLLYHIEEAVMRPVLTLKVVGYQWYWNYQLTLDATFFDYFAEKANLTSIKNIPSIFFDSYMIQEPDLFPGQFRNLETDKYLMIPENVTIRVLVTGNDVIHSWAVPSFGFKLDGVPGRLNQGWLKARLGTYYGQCSEICGLNHSFMPIKVKVETMDRFISWYKSHLLKCYS